MEKRQKWGIQGRWKVWRKLKKKLFELLREKSGVILKVIFIVITLSVFSGLIGTHISSAQDKGLMDMEKSLISDYKNMITADYWNRFDSLAPAFKEKLKTVLADKRTHEFPFDRLKKHITITRGAPPIFKTPVNWESVQA